MNISMFLKKSYMVTDSNLIGPQEKQAIMNNRPVTIEEEDKKQDSLL